MNKGCRRIISKQYLWVVKDNDDDSKLAFFTSESSLSTHSGGSIQYSRIHVPIIWPLHRDHKKSTPKNTPLPRGFNVFFLANCTVSESSITVVAE